MRRKLPQFPCGRRRLDRLAAACAGAAAIFSAGAWNFRVALVGISATAAPARETPVEAATEATGTKKCESLRVELMDKVLPRISRWERAAAEGRTILGYGTRASKLLNKTLASFDALAEQELGSESGKCAEQREVLNKVLQRQLYSIFLVQQSMIEQTLYQRLKKDLLRRMRRRRRELDVKEKLRLLQTAMNDYDSQVRDLLPFFVRNSERDRAERRLSELQWGILDTPEGKDMQQRWKMERMRRMPMRQSKGVSVSLSPGLRLMFRPGGLGNLQLFSRRQVGPPHNPNEVSIAMLNDGKVVDVYNKRPKPPLIKFQPTVGIDISTG